MIAQMVNFSCVYNVKDYSDSAAQSDDSAIAKALQDASKNPGGGVVYLPSGNYQLQDNVMVPSNVVIRGEPTTDPAKSGSNPGKLDPKTKVSCPDRKHLGFLNADPGAKNIGIVNLNLDGCAIMLWPGLVSSAKPTDLKDYWWEATDVQGMGSNKVVLGNKVSNVMFGYPDPDHTSGNEWPWRFSTAIAAYSQLNLLVGNNMVAEATSSTKVTVTFSGTEFKDIEFPYDNRYGIDVNRGKSLHCGAATNAPVPSFFRVV